MAVFRDRKFRNFFILLVCICAAATAIGFTVSVPTGIFSCALSAALLAAFFVFTRRRYRDIALLSEQIDRVLHGNDPLSIDECNEGELSILQSEIRKMTVRLKENAEALRDDKRHLADSLADISHQLRTPLTSINMVVSFLGETGLETARRLELVRELESLLARIDWLISSLLKISKIDAGTAVFQQKHVPVADLVRQAAEPLLIPLELRNISLSVSGDGGASFRGDINWTAEAVGNILKNCMEHTDEGGTIEVTYGGNALYTEIVIRDDGSGIDREDLPHIFERFYQGRHAKDGSFGIGLALCRMILSAQNATVKASNNAAKGSNFSIRFYHQTV